MFYYIYQITNLVNNKIYVGVHKTHDLNDGYMGSGKVIKAAIQKHGLENFKKDILEFFENAELMYAKEKEVITEEFLAREDVYNLRRGGTGGFDFINQQGLNGFKNVRVAKEGRRRTNEILEEKYGVDWQNQISSKGAKRSMELQRGIHNPLLDKSENAKKAHLAALSPSARIKRKETLERIGHQKGEKNSNYGKCWIFCWWLEKNCMIKIELLPLYLEQGWYKGRKLFK